LADLASKAAAVMWDRSGNTGVLTPVRNDGYSLGVVSGTPLVLVVVTVAALGLAGWWYRRNAGPTGSWWVGPAVFGGAVANVVDRAVFGAVHDFIATPWIVFNIADVAVAVGLVGFYRDLYSAYVTRGGEHHEQPAPQDHHRGNPRRTRDHRDRRDRAASQDRLTGDTDPAADPRTDFVGAPPPGATPTSGSMLR
jgi:lipoprotein signal peptidase